jgi:hypothetical protein
MALNWVAGMGYCFPSQILHVSELLRLEHRQFPTKLEETCHEAAKLSIISVISLSNRASGGGEPVPSTELTHTLTLGITGGRHLTKCIPRSN